MDLKRLKHPKLIGKNSECDPISRSKVTQEHKTPNYSELVKAEFSRLLIYIDIHAKTLKSWSSTLFR